MLLMIINVSKHLNAIIGDLNFTVARVRTKNVVSKYGFVKNLLQQRLLHEKQQMDL